MRVASSLPSSGVATQRSRYQRGQEGGAATPDADLRRLLVLILLCSAALPIEINAGTTFSLAPADFVAALLLPYVLLSRHKSPDGKLVLAGIYLSGIGILIFALSSPNLYPVLTAAFFWKSWIIYLAAYKWVVSAHDLHAQVMKLLKGVGVAIWIALTMTTMAWLQSGMLIRYSTRPDGTTVLGYTAGTWDQPIQLYGWGQVNNTGALFVVGLAIFVTLTIGGRGMTRLLGASGTAMAMVVIAPSGSRGSLVAALLFIAAAFATRFFQGRNVSVGAIVALGLIVAVTAVMLPQVIAETPKYLATLDALTSPNSTRDVTHGRGDLVGLMIEDIRRSPILGTAFGDFARFRPNAPADLVSASPHNTYLGPFHKGGLLIGLVYSALVIRALPLRKGALPASLLPLKWPLVISLMLGLFLVTDVFTTSVVAAVTLTVLGATRGLEVAQKERSTEEGHAAAR